jgi:ATP-dependent RNA helicase MSS116
MPNAVQLISEGTLDENFKIMVFCNTAMTTSFLASFFEKAGLPRVLAIHSRMTQPARTRASDMFRKSVGGHVLFTSDVSARGVDYPGTTLIIQVGLPADRATYVHRLGRTARAGSTGQGILLLCDYEDQFVQRELGNLPITRLYLQPLPDPGQIEWFDAVKRTLRATGSSDLEGKAIKAYLAYLGFMNSKLKILEWDQARLVQEANDFAYHIGLRELPVIKRSLVGKMGLKGVPGLRLQ